MTRQKQDENFSTTFQETVIGFPKDNIYNRSFQEALNRPITVDFSDPNIYQHGIITTYTTQGGNEAKKRYSTLINGNSEEKETPKEPSKDPLRDEKFRNSLEKQLLKQISGGSGTDKAGSKGNFDSNLKTTTKAAPF